MRIGACRLEIGCERPKGWWSWGLLGGSHRFAGTLGARLIYLAVPLGAGLKAGVEQPAVDEGDHAVQQRPYTGGARFVAVFTHVVVSVASWVAAPTPNGCFPVGGSRRAQVSSMRRGSSWPSARIPCTLSQGIHNAPNASPGDWVALGGDAAAR